MENNMRTRQQVSTSGDIWNEIQIANIRLQEHEFHNRMEVEKKVAIEKMRADLCSIRDFQQTKLIEDNEGRLILWKQQFGNPIRGVLPMRDFCAKKLILMNEDKASVLYVSFSLEKKRNREIELWIPGDKIGDARFVWKIFARAGVCFGFSKAKERDLQARILYHAVCVAKDVVLPPIKGWYQTEEGWKYAMQDTECWKGVERWMK